MLIRPTAFASPRMQLVLYILLCLVFFTFAKAAFIGLPMQLYKFGNIVEGLMWLSGIVLLVSTYHVRMAALPPAMAVILKFMFAMFGVYLAFPLTLPSDIALPSLTYARVMYGFMLWPILCILGFYRPAFGILAIMAALWNRVTLSDILGQALSKTEYFPLAEVALFMLIGAALLPLAKKVNWLKLAQEPLAPNDKLSLLEKISLIGISVHLSNYFYSGVKKIFLGENPFSWTLYNETWSLMLTANTLGHLPVSFHDGLMQLSIEAFQHTFILGNAAIFIGQLLAIVAGVRIRWIIWATLFYDLTHILIFVTTGIFFYKWIILNIAIIAALVSIRDKVIPRFMAVIIVITVAAAPTVFYVAKLGWWDTRALNHERFYAITDTGEEIEVPTNYWGSFSVNYAQSRRIRHKTDGFFPTGTAAIIFGQENMRTANACAFNLPPEGTADAISKTFATDKNKISNHVRLHHKYVLEHVNTQGLIAYDLEPHHIWSMPWRFRAFNALDKRRIVAYRYVVEAKCLGYEAGQITQTLKRRGDHVITLN